VGANKKKEVGALGLVNPNSTLAPTVALADLAVRSATLLPHTYGYLVGVASGTRGRAAREEVLQLHCRRPTALPDTL
jgi:hypothetical protein